MVQHPVKAKVVTLLLCIVLIAVGAAWLQLRSGGCSAAKSSPDSQGPDATSAGAQDALAPSVAKTGTASVDSPTGGQVPAKPKPAEHTTSPRQANGRSLSGSEAVPTTGLPELLDDDGLDIALGLFDGEVVDMALMRAMWAGQDKTMEAWPPYADARAGLEKELAEKIDLLGAAPSELVTIAVALRDQYWQAGGDLSPQSYPSVYKARLLLELAHARQPQNMDITDELVETISAASTIWSVDQTSGLKHIQHAEPIEAILALRSEQFQQVKHELEQGREATPQDFLCACDTAFLLTRVGESSRPKAREAFEWLVRYSERGHWGFYDPLFRECLRDVTHGEPGEPVNFNVWLVPSGQSVPVGMYRNARRVPSSRGDLEHRKIFLRFDDRIDARAVAERLLSVNEHAEPR